MCMINWYTANRDDRQFHQPLRIEKMATMMHCRSVTFEHYRTNKRVVDELMNFIRAFPIPSAVDSAIDWSISTARVRYRSYPTKHIFRRFSERVPAAMFVEVVHSNDPHPIGIRWSPCYLKTLRAMPGKTMKEVYHFFNNCTKEIIVALFLFYSSTGRRWWKML